MAMKYDPGPPTTKLVVGPDGIVPICGERSCACAQLGGPCEGRDVECIAPEGHPEGEHEWEAV
jgi:hypothetical protein